MNVLIIGSGGREHAIAWKISKSSMIKKLIVCPGNAGTELIAQNIELDINDFNKIKLLCIEEEIDIVIVGPEDPLVNGISDYFEVQKELMDVTLIGPCKKAAQLEGSKDFAKEFMKKYNIPTAKHKTFDINSIESGYKFLENLSPPYVLKADGLAAGKGVLILDKLTEAKKCLKEMILENKFGNASEKVVIEEFLEGMELSVFVLTDGSTYKVLPTAKDYKRIGEKDTGLNTGGMGAVSPATFIDRFYLEKIEMEIVKPTIEGLRKENINYLGFIFFGLIDVEGDPKVIEYNVRMGDPESEVVFPRIKSDLLNLLVGIKNGTFSEKDLHIDKRVAVTVMLASQGYPENYEKNKLIDLPDDFNESLIFHSGTKSKSGNLYTSGGRVMCVTTLSENLNQALEKSLKVCSKINFDGKYYRKDIGRDLINY